jgi:aminotransferase
VIEAGIHSLESRRTHYTSNYGTIELRRALAHHLERLYGVKYDPTEEILITIGASEALDMAVPRHLDPGDEVILHEPSYVSYRPAVIFAGGVPVGVDTSLAEDFALDPAKVEAAITPRTKAILLNYPCNPTGAVLDPTSRTRSPASPSATTCWSTATRSTTASSTAATRCGRWPRCRACAAARS